MKGPDDSDTGERFGKTGKEDINWKLWETELEREIFFDTFPTRTEAEKEAGRTWTNLGRKSDRGKCNRVFCVSKGQNINTTVPQTDFAPLNNFI